MALVVRTCVLFLGIWITTILLAAAIASPTTPSEHCSAVNAVRGTPVVLGCVIRGCHDPHWYNTTGGRHLKIESGVDPATGELTVTESATSYVGGQRYMCNCGAHSKCYNIHVPPLVSVHLSKEVVVAGGRVNVTCSVHDGFPLPHTILLVHSKGSVFVKNGEPMVLGNLTVESSGEVRCEVNNVPGQPSASTHLTVFNQPQIVNTEDGTYDNGRGGSVTLSCTVRLNQCNTAIMFFKEGAPVEISSERLLQFSKVSHDYQELESFLIIKGVEHADFGRYECRVYANYSSLLLVTSQELFVLPSSTPTTLPPSGGVSPEDNSSSQTGLVGLVVAVMVAIVFLIIIIILSICIYKLRRSLDDKKDSEEKV